MGFREGKGSTGLLLKFLKPNPSFLKKTLFVSARRCGPQMKRQAVHMLRGYPCSLWNHISRQAKACGGLVILNNDRKIEGAPSNHSAHRLYIKKAPQLTAYNLPAPTWATSAAAEPPPQVFCFTRCANTVYMAVDSILFT